MGGPCFIVNASGARVKGPSGTDNFQVLPFTFDGRVWQSVEQAFQALKHTERAAQERIRAVARRGDESDAEHGMRCYNEGHRGGGRDLRADWDRVKVDLMYQLCLAKLQQHPEHAAELLATGRDPIEGGRSTSWRHPRLGEQSWTHWNGRVQMRVREMLRPEAERDAEGLLRLEAEFSSYQQGLE